MSVISIDSWNLWYDFFKDSNQSVFWNSSKTFPNSKIGIYLFLDCQRHFFISWPEFWNQCKIIRQSLPDSLISKTSIWSSIHVASNFFVPFALGALWLIEKKLEKRLEKKSSINLISDNPEIRSVFGVYHSGVNRKLQSKFTYYYSWGIGQFLSNRIRFQSNQIDCLLYPPWTIQDSILYGSDKQFPLTRGMSGNGRLLRIISKNVLDSDFIFTKKELEEIPLKWTELPGFMNQLGKFKKTIPESDNKIHLITEIKNYFRLLTSRSSENKMGKEDNPKISMNWIINGDEYISIDESRIGDVILKSTGFPINLYHNLDKRLICLSDKYEESIENWVKLSQKTKQWWKEKNQYSPNILLCNLLTKDLIEKIKSNLGLFDVIVFILDNPTKKQFLLSISCESKYHLKMKLGINSLLTELI